MEIVWLVTPQHTGTHFARILLELHPQINYWILESFRYDDVSHKMCDACLGKLSKEDFKKFILKQRPEPRFIQESLYFAKELAGLEIKDKNDLRYCFIHSHGGEMRDAGGKHPEGIKYITTLREPLLAVITALRRQVRPGCIATANHVIATLQVMPEEAFVICTDLWRDSKEKLLEVFKFLNLEPHKDCIEYCKRWPVINFTSQDEIKTYGDPDPKWQSDLAEAKRLLLEEKKIHPCLEEWVEKLRTTNLQERFERHGYKNLLWFR